MAKKSTVKSTVPVGVLTPQPHGGALRNGGTNKGGPGRPPKAVAVPFREFMQTIRDDPEARDALASAAKDAESRSFSTAWKYATDYDPEKPAEKHDVVIGLSKLLADL